MVAKTSQVQFSSAGNFVVEKKKLHSLGSERKTFLSLWREREGGGRKGWEEVGHLKARDEHMNAGLRRETFW